MKYRIRDKGRQLLFFTMLIVLLAPWVWSQETTEVLSKFRASFNSWSTSQLREHKESTREDLMDLLNRQFNDYEESVQKSQLEIESEIEAHAKTTMEEADRKLMQYEQEMKAHIKQASEQAIAYYETLAIRENENIEKKEDSNDILSADVVQ